ncbi:MAG: hypothetical protein U0640_15050 [Phycisphaerales bacterium]
MTPSCRLALLITAHSGYAMLCHAQIVAVDTTPFSTSRALCITPDGSIAGGTFDVGSVATPFRWTQAGGATPLPMLASWNGAFVTATSSSGDRMLGNRTTSGSPSPRAVRWINAGTNPVAQELGLPASADPNARSDAMDMDASGVISVGRVFINAGQSYAAVRWDNQTATFLSTTSSPSEAIAISNSGAKIVGWEGSVVSRPTLWDNNTRQFLPMGPVWDTGVATAISGDGNVIAGSVFDIGTNVRQLAFWSTPLSEPVTIGSGDLGANIEGMSLDGSIAVGIRPSGAEGFVWSQATGLLTPSAYFLTRGVDTSEWTNLQVYGVSDDGTRFVGVGLLAGDNRGFVLTVPSPASFVLVVGALGQFARRRVRLAQ